MDSRQKYRNRHGELVKLVEKLRVGGFTNIEELTTTLSRTICGYAAQLGIEPLRPRELEYVWLKLIE